LGLLAAADQFLGLGEQERAKNGERGDVHDSQERAQRRLVPRVGLLGPALMATSASAVWFRSGPVAGARA
jgi:hypothetical protein